MNGEVYIIMVHGTWGRGFFPTIAALVTRRPRWFQPGSGFHTGLFSELSARQIDAQSTFVEWSGSNSFKERELAARKVAQSIETRVQQFPNTPVLLLGHSHGGNVVSRALSNTTVDLDRIYVTTLATPFLEVFKTKLTASQERSLNMLFMFFFLAFVALSNFTIQQLFPELREKNGFDLPNIAAVIGILAIALIGATSIYPLLVRRSAAQLALVEMISSQSGVLRVRDRRLVVRAVDDEATLVITTGAIGTRLASLAFSIIGALRPSNLVWPAIGFILEYAWWNVPRLPFGIEIYFHRIASILFAATFLVPLLVFLLVVFAAFFRAAYGRELAIAGVNCEVSAHSAPDGHGLEIVTLRQSNAARRLRHYIYDEPSCGAAVADWIAARIKNDEISTGSA
ncbi:hypothetical protein ABIF63_000024 [Bradyrhizobium japonicum]|uniref:AB hydrolase-1 domain-containing protein n=1 Tax=Bradyrhizobium japonicum TaxID=375 RepID=A0ABV2RG63_BRAJP